MKQFKEIIADKSSENNIFVLLKKYKNNKKSSDLGRDSTNTKQSNTGLGFSRTIAEDALCNQIIGKLQQEITTLTIQIIENIFQTEKVLCEKILRKKINQILKNVNSNLAIYIEIPKDSKLTERKNRNRYLSFRENLELDKNEINLIIKDQTYNINLNKEISSLSELLHSSDEFKDELFKILKNKIIANE